MKRIRISALLIAILAFGFLAGCTAPTTGPTTGSQPLRLDLGPHWYCREPADGCAAEEAELWLVFDESTGRLRIGDTPGPVVSPGDYVLDLKTGDGRIVFLDGVDAQGHVDPDRSNLHVVGPVVTNGPIALASSLFFYQDGALHRSVVMIGGPLRMEREGDEWILLSGPSIFDQGTLRSEARMTFESGSWPPDRLQIHYFANDATQAWVRGSPDSGRPAPLDGPVPIPTWLTGKVLLEGRAPDFASFGVPRTPATVVDDARTDPDLARFLTQHPDWFISEVRWETISGSERWTVKLQEACALLSLRVLYAGRLLPHVEESNGDYDCAAMAHDYRAEPVWVADPSALYIRFREVVDQAHALEILEFRAPGLDALADQTIDGHRGAWAVWVAGSVYTHDWAGRDYRVEEYLAIVEPQAYQFFHTVDFVAESALPCVSPVC